MPEPLPLPLPTCSPSDVAAGIVRRRRADAERRLQNALRVLEWNRQMMAAQEIIVAADLAGHGVIIRVSYARNEIEAVPHETVPRHEAYVFDYDRPHAAPVRKRLHVQYTPTIPTPKD